ncbi:Sporulation inhibitor kipI [Dermatophilus congolensis]|uniref:Sporulation inhibitor kipI n=1 Tax=Dermatophilus congolensis TaxID=1863 RepID=A0A239VU50_9MICO|nr:carboxyltransferase domain-containing protein [Dermatophilus congolensis]SNV25652.1 Sporulation inhibitor kipI [Dermatophilus congolensis]
MKATLHPVGDRAILIDLPDEHTRRALDTELRQRRTHGWLNNTIIEQIPAAQTILLRLATPTDTAALATELRHLLPTLTPTNHTTTETTTTETTIPVTYNGEDLHTLAHHLNTTPTELITWHTHRPWTVDFCGFMPGFAYLTRQPDPNNHLDTTPIPRHHTPRTRIPAGSVALAAHWSAIYPHPSPGGWQLIGHTTHPIWNIHTTPPTTLRPGQHIRFQETR